MLCISQQEMDDAMLDYDPGPQGARANSLRQALENKALEIGIPLDMSTFRSWRSDDLEALMANARLLRQLTDATTRQAQALVEAMASAASCDLAQGCVGKDGKDGLAHGGYGDG